MLSLKKISSTQWLWVLLVMLLIFRLASLAAYPLTDTTEARYAEISRKMLETKNFITPLFAYDQPFWGKPPFSFWVSASSMALVGVTAFGARFGVFIVNLLVLGLLFSWKNSNPAHQDSIKLNSNSSKQGEKSNAEIANNERTSCERPSCEGAINERASNESVSKVTSNASVNQSISNQTPNTASSSNEAKQDQRLPLGLVASLIFMTTPLGFVSSGAVMTDMSLVLGTTLSMVAFYKALQGSKIWSWLFFVGLAIGLLSKGLVGVILVAVPTGLYTLLRWDFKLVWRALPWGFGLLLTLALTLPWYLWAEYRTPGFLEYFILGEHWARFTVTNWSGDLYGSAHPRAKGTIWLYALTTTLPWGVILAWVLYKLRGQLHGFMQPVTLYLCCWVVGTLLFFTLAGNILPAYVLPALPAFSLLTARYVRWFQAQAPQTLKYWKVVAYVLVLMAVALPITVPLLEARSQRQLLENYDSKTGLVYFDRPIFSAQFYSQGRAVTAKTKAELEHWLQQSQPLTVVVDVREVLKKDVQIPPNWRELARKGDWLMLVNN